MYYDQFSSNSNKISLFILKNLVLTSDKKSDFILKNLKKTISSILMISHQIVYVSPSLAASLKPLAHRRNASNLSLFCRYYFDRCSSELQELVLLPHSRGRSTRYSDRLLDVSGAFPRFYNDVYVNSFFPRTPKLWNSLPAECFPLTYDLNGFNSRVNRYLFFLGFLHETQLKKNGSS